MMNFEQGLQAQLDDDPQLAKSANGKRIAGVLAMTNLKRRKRILGRMEAHARAHTGFQGKDWGRMKAPDWASILQLFIQLLPLILALFA